MTQSQYVPTLKHHLLLPSGDSKKTRLASEPVAASRTDYTVAEGSRPRLSYHDKVILAPMVRTGECPLRLTALHYGAHLVFSPEIVDKKIIGNDRITGQGMDGRLVRYVKKDGYKEETSFTCHPSERNRLILQLGSASRDLAVQAALTVVRHGDVAGVDLNCGCPKHFSTSGGMGAQLLTDPDRLCSILQGLVEEVPCPISCKIRMLPSQDETVTLVKRLAMTGISAMTVHCRTKEMRSSEPALLERLRELVDAVRSVNPTMALVANGDCWDANDVARIKAMTGVDSLMIARGAQQNPSCFHARRHDMEQEVIPRFLAYAQLTSNHLGNSKFILSQMYRDRARSDPMRKSGKANGFMKSKSMDEILAVYAVDRERNAELIKAVEEECKDSL